LFFFIVTILSNIERERRWTTATKLLAGPHTLLLLLVAEELRHPPCQLLHEALIISQDVENVSNGEPMDGGKILAANPPVFGNVGGHSSDDIGHPLGFLAFRWSWSSVDLSSLTIFKI
jgi:hypothetical protein